MWGTPQGDSERPLSDLPEEPPATTEEPPATAEGPPATAEEPPATAEPLESLLPLRPPANAEEPLLPLKIRLLPRRSACYTEEPPATCKVRPRNLPARPTGLEKRDIAAVSLAACAAYARKKYSMFAITTADIETALNPKTDTEPDPVSALPEV
ncbi:hypothetical protein PDIDSM_2916 [Penicillium digitatum]|nr:hypothetical protein PDIDSM_2916 [Penicillium digitatum]